MKQFGQIFKGICSGLAYVTLLLAYMEIMIFYAKQSDILFIIVAFGGAVLIIKVADKLNLFE